MQNKYKVQIIDYDSVLLVGFCIGASFVAITYFMALETIGLLFNSVGHLITLILSNYLFRGVFNVTDLDKTSFKITWLKKPMFSAVVDWEIDKSKISNIYYEQRFYTPDLFELSINEESSLSLKVPIISLNNDFHRFRKALENDKKGELE